MQIVFVSSDMTREDALTHFASDEQGNWLALAWEDGLSAKLKRRYGVWSMREAQELGMAGRRSGVPAVVVIGPDGAEKAFLPGERHGSAALREWQPERATAWPRPDEL